MPEQTRLAESLAGLSGVALSSPLEQVLVTIAEFATQAIPGADGAGLALIESNRPDTVVASAPFVRDVDAFQYRLDEGPCLQACQERRTQMSASLSEESRWARFGPEAARLGVESALSLPLLVEGDVLIGSLNVYGRARDAFTGNAVRVGELFADPAAVSVANAQLLMESRRLASRFAEERVRLEAQLRQSQRLEVFGQLAGAVAHDFNNILGAIGGYTDFVADEVVAAVTADPDRWQPVVGDLTQIRQSADRAARLVHQLLAFGRGDVAEPRALDLSQVVVNLEGLLRRALGEHITLRFLLRPDLWPIKADTGQLEQVLLNLAVNARDAMPRGGTLTVVTRNVDASTNHSTNTSTSTSTNHSRPLDGAGAAGRGVDLVVRDTGTGMDAEAVERAFELFFTTKPDGTGMGLATVHGIVAQAGGDTRIDSRPGAGTTVTASFPASDDVA